MPTLAERWIEEGREQGLEQGLERGLEQGLERGLEQGLEAAILQALEVRFGSIPAGLVEKVEAVDAPALLRELHRLALTVGSLDDFRQEIDQRAT